MGKKKDNSLKRKTTARKMGCVCDAHLLLKRVDLVDCLKRVPLLPILRPSRLGRRRHRARRR